jgi:hypothetical protein
MIQHIFGRYGELFGNNRDYYARIRKDSPNDNRVYGIKVIHNFAAFGGYCVDKTLYFQNVIASLIVDNCITLPLVEGDIIPIGNDANLSIHLGGNSGQALAPQPVYTNYKQGFIHVIIAPMECLTVSNCQSSGQGFNFILDRQTYSVNKTAVSLFEGTIDQVANQVGLLYRIVSIESFRIEFYMNTGAGGANLLNTGFGLIAPNAYANADKSVAPIWQRFTGSTVAYPPYSILSQNSLKGCILASNPAVCNGNFMLYFEGYAGSNSLDHIVIQAQGHFYDYGYGSNNQQP